MPGAVLGIYNAMRRHIYCPHFTDKRDTEVKQYIYILGFLLKCIIPPLSHFLETHVTHGAPMILN